MWLESAAVAGSALLQSMLKALQRKTMATRLV
jgi:hypothetical protein